MIGMANEKGLSFSVVWTGDLQSNYSGDPLRLRQMLSNLIGNAIKFTDKGHITVEVTERREDGASFSMLEFSVTDTGIGIPQEKLGLLFNPFSQVDSSAKRRFNGTGLGLSIVRSLAEQMKGGVGVESTIGKGSRFWFYVELKPIAKSASVPEHRLTGHVVEVLKEKSLRLSHLLVVDDNKVNLMVIQGMLKKNGLTYHAAQSGEEALSLIVSGIHFDLVLMDRQMPNMDGLEASQKIREWEVIQQSIGNNRRLPIIAFTADAFPEDMATCLAGGMDDFLIKPVKFELLQAMLDKWS
jgi:two-component system, sensor histidine kinase